MVIIPRCGTAGGTIREKIIFEDERMAADGFGGSSGRVRWDGKVGSHAASSIGVNFTILFRSFHEAQGLSDKMAAHLYWGSDFSLRPLVHHFLAATACFDNGHKLSPNQNQRARSCRFDVEWAYQHSKNREGCLCYPTGSSHLRFCQRTPDYD